MLELRKKTKDEITVCQFTTLVSRLTTTGRTAEKFATGDFLSLQMNCNNFSDALTLPVGSRYVGLT